MWVGTGLLLGVTVLACALLTGWRYLPSPLGDWLGILAGVISTPFLMEGFFLCCGFFLILWLNQHRRRAEGEEWVDLAKWEESGTADGSSAEQGDTGQERQR